MATSRRSPPQLQLAFSTPPHQSFKRSFQQFGLDVDSPQSAGGSTSDVSQANNYGTTTSSSSTHESERNKRVRSEGRTVEYGEASVRVESERARALIPEFMADTMEGVEIGSSESLTASGSQSLAHDSSSNSLFDGSSSLGIETIDVSMQTIEEQNSVAEPPGIPVGVQPSRRGVGDTETYRVRARINERSTLPSFGDMNRPSLHPALRARPTSPVTMTPPTLSTSTRLDPSNTTTPNSIESLNAAINRARAFDASLEPLRHTPVNLTNPRSYDSRSQQRVPRPRARELHPDQLERLHMTRSDDEDDEEGSESPRINEYIDRDRVLGGGNPVIPTMATSADVGLSPFSVNSVEWTNNHSNGTATSMLRRRLETVSQQAEHGSPPRRIRRLSSQDPHSVPRSHQLSNWSPEDIRNNRNPESSALLSLDEHISSLLGEMHSPTRSEEHAHTNAASSVFNPFYGLPREAGLASRDESALQDHVTYRRARRRPRTLLNSVNRDASPVRATSTGWDQPVATLRRILQSESSSFPSEPRFDSIFAPSELHRERVLPPPTISTERQPVGSISNSLLDRVRGTHGYMSDGEEGDIRELARTGTLAYELPNSGGAARSLYRPSMFFRGSDDLTTREPSLPDLYSVYNDGEVEREAEQLARLSNPIASFPDYAEPPSSTVGRNTDRNLSLRPRDDEDQQMDRGMQTRFTLEYQRLLGRQMEASRRSAADYLSNLREQGRTSDIHQPSQRPLDPISPWQPRHARALVPDFDFDDYTRSSRHSSDPSTESLRSRLFREARQRQQVQNAAEERIESGRYGWASAFETRSSFGDSRSSSSTRNVSHGLFNDRPPTRPSQNFTSESPRARFVERSNNGWIPAPRAPTRYVDAPDVPSLAELYNDPSFDIPPSPPLELHQSVRAMERPTDIGHYSDREHLNSLGSGSAPSRAYRAQATSEIRPQDNGLGYASHTAGANRERLQAHRLLARRYPYRSLLRREQSPVEHRSSTNQNAPTLNDFSGSAELSRVNREYVERSTSSSRSSGPNADQPTRSWGDIEGILGEDTLGHFGETIRRRRQASLNPPVASLDGPDNGTHQLADYRWTPVHSWQSHRNRLRPNQASSNGATLTTAHLARRQRLPSLQNVRSSFVEEPLSSRTLSSMGVRRRVSRNTGDFVRDEDFDSSYEGLLALAATLGEVKSRSTPGHVIDALPTGTFEEWRKSDSDARCPICLDDYLNADILLRCEPCAHWCHRECLQQWLHTARTCPVCRANVHAPGRAPSPPVPGPSNINNINNDDEDNSSDDESSWASPAIPSDAVYRLLQSSSYFR